MRQAGLEPKAPQTWDELVEMAVHLRDWAKTENIRNFSPINMRNEDWMLKGFILQNGGELMNADYSAALINEPAAVEAIEFWVSLIDLGLMPAGAHGRARDQFIAGNQAFLFDSTAGIGSISQTVDFEMATAMLPGNKRRAVTLGGGWVDDVSRYTGKRRCYLGVFKLAFDTRKCCALVDEYRLRAHSQECFGKCRDAEFV